MLLIDLILITTTLGKWNDYLYLTDEAWRCLVHYSQLTPLGRGRAGIWTQVNWRSSHTFHSTILLQHTKCAFTAGPLHLLALLPWGCFSFRYCHRSVSHLCSQMLLHLRGLHWFHCVCEMVFPSHHQAILGHPQGIWEFKSILTLFTVSPERAH